MPPFCSKAIQDQVFRAEGPWGGESFEETGTMCKGHVGIMGIAAGLVVLGSFFGGAEVLF